MYDYKYFYRYVNVTPTGFYFNNEALGGQVGYMYIDTERKNVVLKPVSFFDPTGGSAELQGITTINTQGIMFDGEPSITLNDVPHGAVRPGTILMYVGNVEPPGWFFCNGKSISKTRYSTLFSILGYTFTNNTVKNNSTLFTLPDFRYRTVKQLDTTTPSGGTAYGAINNRGGKHEHILTNDQLPDHLHDGTTPIHNTTHNHHYVRDAPDNRYGPVPDAPYNDPDNKYKGLQNNITSIATPFVDAINPHTHPVKSSSTTVFANNGTDMSTNTYFSVIQPSVYISFIIKT